MVTSLIALSLYPPTELHDAPTDIELVPLEVEQIQTLKYTWPGGSAIYRRITDNFFITELPDTSFPAGFAPYRAIER